MLRADWLAGCHGGYKGTKKQYVRSLVEVAREDDMTDWEPDKLKTYSSIFYSKKTYSKNL